jgi:uncharacterized protein YdeI (YjbR/CyaY-like superfamily)
MGQRDPRVDAYIAKAAPFAQPILRDIRDTVHAACPDVQEAMKWSFPHFTYKGMLCSMAAFKQHAAFGFWKGSLVIGSGKNVDAMGQFGRIAKRSDLPSNRMLAAYVRKAARLNDEGVKAPRAPKKAAPKALRMPPDVAAALERVATARATFDGLSPSGKREYLEWITQARTEATRQRRLRQAIEWLAEGKSRNWKYERPQSKSPRP